MTEYKKLNHMLLIMFMIGISFFCVEKTNAYFQFTKTSTTSFTTATYQNLELATDKNLYGLCNQDATILLTVGNTNTYNMGYTITFSNNNLDYTIDGAPATTYTLPGNGSKTHTIVVSGTTQTSTLTITVTPNSPYGSIHTKVVNFDLICPVCTWGGVSLPNLTATLTQNYEITCTDTGSGMTSPTLGTSNFISSNTNVAKINSVSAPSAVTNGYKYTLTVEGLKAGSFSLTMKAGATKDQTNNQNNITTSTTINTIRRTPTMTVSSNTSTLTYGGTNGSITYTYSGNGVPSLTNTAPEVATAIIDTANKTITITPVTAGSTTIGLVAPETNQYTTISKNIVVTVNKRAVTYKANNASKEYDGSALTNASGCTLTSGSLISGHIATCTNSGTITNYGNSTNTLNTVVIKSGSTDVSSNYAITKTNGTLSISKRTVTITAGTTSKTYDGSALTYSVCSGNRLVSGHTVTCTMTAGSTITNYTSGGATNTISAAVIKSGSTDLTNNYAITNATGTLTINKRPVTYKADNASKTYDGSALTNASGCTITSGSLVSGHTVTCTNTGTITNYGSTTNTLSTVVIKSGTTDVSSNYAITKTNGTLSISKRAVTYKANNASKEYDGTALTNASGCTITSGSLVSGHAATCTNTGTITNYGSTTNTLDTVIIKSGATDVSNNYNITKTNGTLSISKRTVTITAGTTSKTYDGSALTYATCSGNRLVSGQTVTCTMTTGSTITNVGSETNTISTRVIKSGSTDLTNNYTITNATGTLTINKKTLTPSATASNKTYNGNTSATCAITLSGAVSGESPTATASGAFNNATVGTGKTVTCSSITLGSSWTTNYSLSTTSVTTTANITKKSLTPSATASNKTYNGNTSATCAITLSGAISGESPTATGSGTFANANVGTGKTVTCSGITLGSSWTTNYSLSTTSVTTTANITARAVTYKADNASKTYDGSALTNASGCTITSGSLVSGHTVTCTNTGSITNSGSTTNTLSTVVIKSGTTDVSSNYAITKTNGTLTINKKQLTVSGTTASNKTYNATTAAATTLGTVSGVVSGDAVTTTVAGTFDNKNVGTGKTVTLVYSISGTDAENYIKPVNGTTTANITKKALTITGLVATNRVYDGSTSVTLSGGTLNGKVSGDTVTATMPTSGTIASANVGTGKAVTYTTIAPSGTDAGNYSITQPSVTVNITQKQLTVSGTTASNKTYNATTAATTTLGTISGVVSGDAVTTTVAGTFDNKNVGTGKTVTLVYSISGTDAGNYIKPVNGTTTANITKKALTITGLVATNRVYDGSTSVTLSGGTLNGKVNGDTVTATMPTSGTIASANVGTGKAVTYTTIAPSGTDAGNYSITQPTVTVNITVRPITITAKNQTIIEGNSIATGVGQVTYTATSTNGGLVSGHSLDSITLTPSIDYIGTGTIMPSAAIIESAAITSNYSISYATGTLTILIPARTYTITFYRNGAASIGGSTANYITRSCTIAAGNNASTCSITTPVIVGVTATPNVIGWGTEANSHTSTVAVNTSIDISDDGAYYAQTQSSQSSYSAMFYRNTATTIDGSSLASLTETCSTVRTYNGEAMLTTCNITTPTIEKSGYIILGWSTNATNPSSFIPANSPLAITSASNVYYAITGWNGNNMCSVTGAVSNPYNSAQCIFRGDNPNNYVRFNNTNYRIMSSDSNGKIKFIWNDSTLTGLTSYTYASGAAYTLINSGTYYTGLSSEALSFIEPTIFNIGTVGFYTNTDKYISDVAPAEATNSSSYMSGLLQVSEFLYASTAGGCTSTTPWSTFNKSPYVCTSSNWLLTGYPLHFINNHTASRIKYLKSYKQISYDTSTVSATIKPVHGFKAGVIFIAGSGTSTDPYIPFLNPQTCTIQTTNGYETSKLLTIVPSQATNLTYSWDNTTFNSTTTKTISSAGVFSGYIRTSGGLTNSCSILIASRQEYRVASCDTQWGSWQAGGYICYGTSYPSEQVAQSKQWAEATGASFYFSCGMSFNICNGEHSCRRYTRGCSRYNCGSFGNWTTTPSNSTCYQQVEIRTTYAPS